MGTTLEMPEIAWELTAVAVPDFADLAVVKIRDDLFGDSVPEIAELPVRLRRLAGLDAMNSAGVRRDLPHARRGHRDTRDSLLHESMRTREPKLLRTIRRRGRRRPGAERRSTPG